ncbi:MAG: hypothetical protein ORN54_05495 [Cyclobacteriaceae bacterium]|nr:hypothetical protein [Cyclobacteriaceae bacterium]
MEDLPINLLLFPLVGGYYITTRLEDSKFISQRLSAQAIVFNAVLVGMPLMAISLAITTVITYIFPTHVMWIRSTLFPIKDDFFGTCLLAILISFLYTKIRNHFIDETRAIYSAIEKSGSELELLVAYSFKESQLIQLSLRNDKVYIGWAEVLPKPSHCQYIQLIPLFSGYRDDKKELIIVTNYSLVLLC